MSFRYATDHYVYHTEIYVMIACALRLPLDTVSSFTHTHKHTYACNHYCWLYAFQFNSILFPYEPLCSSTFCFISFGLIHTMSINVCTLRWILWQTCIWLCVNVRLHTRQIVWESRCGRYQNTIEHTRSNVDNMIASHSSLYGVYSPSERGKDGEQASRSQPESRERVSIIHMQLSLASLYPKEYMVYHNMDMRARVPLWSLSQRRQ